jgi:two-component system sensor histidine kinase KdpD
MLAGMAQAGLPFVSFRLHAGPAMAALLFFFLIVLISLCVGFFSTVFACVLATLCFSYFFAPPIYSLRISEPVNIVALIAFTSTALIISHPTRQHSRSWNAKKECQDK